MDSQILRSLFGRRIRSLRRIKDLTQEELAEHSQISAEYISRIERGLASPSFDTLAALSVALRVEPQSLFDFTSLDIESSNDIESTSAQIS